MMGFFDDFFEDTLNLPGPGAVLDGFTGKAGAEAAEEGARLNVLEQRRQFDATQRNLQPFVDAAHSVLPSLAFDSQPDVLGARLNNLNADLRSLRNVRSFTANAAAERAGLPASFAADAGQIDPGVLLDIDAEQQRRGQLLAGLGQSTGVGLSRLGAITGQNIGDALQGGALGAQQSLAQGQSNAIGLAGSLFSLFSDRRLKREITPKGQYKGLTLYEWEWADEAPEFVKDGPRVGFMADEVEALYPEHVHEFAGFKKVDYIGLLEA